METDELIKILNDEYDIEFEGSYCTTKKFRNRHLRIFEKQSVLEISDKDFDRWANSVDSEIEYGRLHSTKKFVKRFEILTQ